MNWTLLNVYSDVYTVAMLRNMKTGHPTLHHESRLGKLVKFFHRG